MEAFNIEHKILNKQPKHIAYIDLGGALESLKGEVFGTSGSVDKSQMNTTTKEQQDALNRALTKAGDFTARESTPFTTSSVLNQSDMKYGKVNPTLQAGDIQRTGYGAVNQGNVSLRGLDQLTQEQEAGQITGYGTDAATVASGANLDYDATYQKSIKQAYKTLADAQKRDQRALGAGGARYASAGDEAAFQRGEEFTNQLAEAIDTKVERSEVDRTKLQLEGLKTAGGLVREGATLEQTGASALAKLELDAYNKASEIGLRYTDQIITGKGMIDQNNIRQAEMEVKAALQAGQITVDEADRLNKLILQRDQMYNQASLTALQTAVSGGTASTLENIVVQDPGKEGLAKPLIAGLGAGIGGGLMGG